ncbi:MAG TPA: PQQ-binding-like beta-propeller repeat protein [Methylomirabilota bacterium]|nr:PQQ-binding-like beta-propeller repeat protein [Methylomirabilota bacterium]
MDEAPAGQPIPKKPLRLWPGVVLVLLQWVIRFGVPLVLPDAVAFAVIGGVVAGLLVIIWWAFFSRAPRIERWGAILLMALALFVTSRLIHVSIATAMMGMMFPLYSIPVLCLAFVVWAVASRGLPERLHRATMVATILLACGGWTLVRTGGFTGDLHHDFAWRWARTPEERLLAQAANEPVAPPAAAAAADVGPDWPGFRGAARDSVIRGVRIQTNWSASPPVQLWRRPVGPGWSSFAVHGDRFYTQEQRGDDELVACYKLATGEPVWRHRDTARFWEANAGAGPRGTPTLSKGLLYTLGATGILNALNAGDGSLAWSRNAAADTGAKLPGWGFSSSPLVVEDIVVVATAGALAAYDLASGKQRWLGPKSGGGYSSPQLLTIDGVAQVLFLNGAGVTSVAPGDGARLWEHPWKGVPMLQPAVTADGDILISTTGDTGGTGIRRIAVTHGAGGWAVEQRWMSSGLKPYFNDFVVHGGHAFGFDGSILACIELKEGKRQWKGGRYGNGQLVLFPDQDVLLVLAENGELVLVGATPEFTEIARFPALTGKTWNHPVLVGDILLVRNSEEMAAFRLALAGS